MSLASLGPQLLALVRSLLFPLLAGVRTVSSAYQSQGTNRPQTSASSAAGAAAAFEVTARVVFPSLTSRIHLVSDAPRRRIKNPRGRRVHGRVGGLKASHKSNIGHA